ncbi:hypothetical protein PtB15_5B810 [Puccinia triticina]|nr:hypothetical protein PtB15_5B810 [Puccinia triticina]
MENPPDKTAEGDGSYLHHLAELVAQGFGNLERKLDPERMLAQDANWTFRALNMDSRETLCNRLHSTLLPLLKDQLTTISTLLEPASMRKGPKSNLEHVLKIQPEFDSNVHQIHFIIHLICPESLSSASQINDQHLKQFKVFRLLELKNKWLLTLRKTSALFREGTEYIQKIKLLKGGSFDVGKTHPYRYRTDIVVDLIKFTIRLLNGSELDIVEDSTKEASLDIVHLLGENLILVDRNLPLRHAFEFRLTHPPLIHLAHLARLPLRLSGLFYKKLSSSQMNSGHSLSLFTQMNSHQLKSLCQLALEVRSDHEALHVNLSHAGGAFGFAPLDVEPFVQTANNLASRFEGPLSSIVNYLVPLIENEADQNYYRDWFAAWDILFRLAIHNFVQAVQNYQPQF